MLSVERARAVHVTVTLLAEGARAMHVTCCCDHVIPCFSPMVLEEKLGLSSSPEWGERGVGPRIVVLYSNSPKTAGVKNELWYECIQQGERTNN